MPYTYILKCSDGTYYTGWTTDIEKRVDVHNSGKGAKYTRCRLPVHLVYLEWQENRSMAQKREAFLRKLNRKQKQEMIKAYQEGNHTTI